MSEPSREAGQTHIINLCDFDIYFRDWSWQWIWACMMRSPFMTNCMLHLLISNNRTGANDSYSDTIEGQFFWDMMQRQWVIGFHCFEGVHYVYLKG
jgi:hypothetical protein